MERREEGEATQRRDVDSEGERREVRRGEEGTEETGVLARPQAVSREAEGAKGEEGVLLKARARSLAVGPPGLSSFLFALLIGLVLSSPLERLP